MRATALIALVLMLAVAPAAAAGRVVHIFHLRWPVRPNQPMRYTEDIRVTGKVRSVDLTYKGQRDPRGFVFDYIVDCAHRGPAFLDWDWVQSGRDLLFRIDMTSGSCSLPGVQVAGTVAALTVTIRTK